MITPDEIQARIPGFENEAKEELEKHITTMLANSLALFASQGYVRVDIDQDSEYSDLHIKWDLYHADVVDKFRDAGWAIRWMGQAYWATHALSRPSYAFALGHEYLPESSVKKNVELQDDNLGVYEFPNGMEATPERIAFYQFHKRNKK